MCEISLWNPSNVGGEHPVKYPFLFKMSSDPRYGPTSHPPGSWDRVLQEVHHKLPPSIPKGVYGLLPCLQSPANWKGSCPFHLCFFALCEKVEYAVVDTVCTVALSHTKIVL